MASQLAREAGAYVTAGRLAPSDGSRLRRQAFVDLDNDALEDVGEVDLVFDVIGGRSGSGLAGLIPPENAGDVTARPRRGPGGLTIDFVVVPRPPNE